MGKLGELRCQHRQTKAYHPNCFYKDKQYYLPKYWLESDVYRQWYDKENCRLGFFDIETSDLGANNGYMLSWAIKPRGEKNVVVEAITQKDILKRDFDKKLIGRLLEEMRQYDVLVGFYSSAFDFPFTYARSKYWGMDYPKRDELYQIDLYFQLRNKVATSSKSLKTLTRFLGIEGKTELDFRYWKLAAFGFQPELDELIEHNRQDVIILENLFDKFENECKFTKRGVL